MTQQEIDGKINGIEKELEQLLQKNCFEKVVGLFRAYEDAMKESLFAFVDGVATENPRFKDNPKAKDFLKRMIGMGFPSGIRGANLMLKNIFRGTAELPKIENLEDLQDMKDMFVRKLSQELGATDYAKQYNESLASAHKMAREANELLTKERSKFMPLSKVVDPAERDAVNGLINSWPFDCPHPEEVVEIMCRAVARGYSFRDLGDVEDALDLVSDGFGDSDEYGAPDGDEAFSVGVDAMLATSKGQWFDTYRDFENERSQNAKSSAIVNDPIMSLKPDFATLWKEWDPKIGEFDECPYHNMHDQVEWLAMCLGVSFAAAAIKKSGMKKKGE